MNTLSKPKKDLYRPQTRIIAVFNSSKDLNISVCSDLQPV